MKALSTILLALLMSMGAWADDELPLCEGDAFSRTACSFTMVDSKYIGEWQDGKLHGQGTYTWADGDNYVGEFKGGKQHGQGTYNYANGEKYVGEWQDGKKHGQGIYTDVNGDKYVGEWQDGKRYKEKWVDIRTEAECTNSGPHTWDAEKQKCVSARALFAFEAFPKLMKDQEESKSFLQSVILFLPEKEGDRENWGEDYEPPVRGGVECWNNGRVTFMVTLNKDKKITRIADGKDTLGSFCVPKEDFNICIAEPFGWDLSMVEDEKVCFSG